MIEATHDRNCSLSSRVSVREFSISRQAVLAAALMAGVCVFVSVLVSTLLWIGYADAVRAHGAPGRILFWVVATALVLWGTLPPPDRFARPGPRISRNDEPALFAALEEVARSTGQTLPKEVYLVNDFGASVTSRGGIMGFGSRRVMLLGVPLMQAVSVQEFKAILAHEFGHYHPGEVVLGPWIHRTRIAIARATERHRRHVPHPAVVWYGNLFLRVTHGVSRSQELVADDLAARAAGARAVISGLRALHETSVAYETYLQQELQPLLQLGYLPSVGAGFVRFLDAPGMDGYLDAVVQYESAAGGTDPLDTHPSLNDRIAALENLPEGSAGDTRRASSLLTDPVQWERLVFRTGPSTERPPKTFEPIEWDQVVDAVYMPLWRARVDSQGHVLRHHTIGTLPTTSAEFIEIGSRLSTGDEEPVTERVRLDRAGQLILAAIVVRVAALGWSVEALPGHETVLRLNGHELRPYSELRAVLDGRVPASRWHDRCTELGIADVPLWGAGTQPAAEGSPDA